MPEFGATDWGRLWLAAYNTAAACDRLEIGRVLAASAGALSLDVAPGRVRAAVLEPGARRAVHAAVRGRPAEAHVLAAALDEAGAEAADLARDGRLRSRLTEWLADVLAAAELEMGCSCPSWTRPCQHLAALALAFAAEVDRDPLRLLDFAVRGFRALLAPRPAEPPRPAGVACGAFWLGGRSEAAPGPTGTAGPRADLPLRVTAPPPVKGKGSDLDLQAVMREVCAAVAGLADDRDIEADIAAVTFGLPAPADGGAPTPGRGGQTRDGE